MGRGGGRVGPQAKAWPHQNYFPGAGAVLRHRYISGDIFMKTTFTCFLLKVTNRQTDIKANR